MIKGIGIDIVEIDRICAVYTKYPVRFMQRILHVSEQKRSQNMNIVQYLASRFAVKEATVKALGTGFSQGIAFTDITLIPLKDGKPSLVLYGNALLLYRKIQASALHVSLSHEKKYCIATVIME
ncbi:MAG: holo-ACP synthase [Desulfovibrionaceae bacterium]